MHQTLIQLAKATGISPDSYKKWRARGVPHRHRLPLLQAAAQRGIALTAEAFQKPCSAPNGKQRSRRASA